MEARNLDEPVGGHRYLSPHHALTCGVGLSATARELCIAAPSLLFRARFFCLWVREPLGHLSRAFKTTCGGNLCLYIVAVKYKTQHLVLYEQQAAYAGTTLVNSIFHRKTGRKACGKLARPLP